jgi:hypothetical protein
MITRRRFNMAAASVAMSMHLKGMHSLASSLAPTVDIEQGSAQANFTPFGYLDNPYHCWNLHPSGVFRSMPGVGFGLYYPAGPGGYFDYKKNGIYHATLRLAFVAGERRLWAPEDYQSSELIATHHSKDVITYRVTAAGYRVDCTFFQSGEDTLAVRIEGDGSKAAEPLRLLLVHEYQLGGASWWGGDGVAASYDADVDAWITHGFAAGTVFACGADAKPRAHFAQVLKDTADLTFESAEVERLTAYEQDCLRSVSVYELTPALLKKGVSAYMARGVNRSAALREMKRAEVEALPELERKRAADAHLWSEAPQLTGAWPQHWKNGWRYDFETLRMMVRQPVGIYRHFWDGMQIQSPRSVLAETSIDMWALSYVDPDAAKAVFLGQFQDAIAPNVPCAREDGSTNMVATDGSECGTSISWCYPFFCAQAIYQRTGDKAWMTELYSKLAEFLKWTLENRSDKDKFIVAKCSWESGMDGSKRFLIDEPTGGETAEFARLVELQAATAQGAAILATFANDLGRSAEAQHWQSVCDTYTVKTQEMWNGHDWFHDFDTRSMRPITSVGRDVGQVAPIFCGIAKPIQVTSMLPALRAFYEESRAGKTAMGQDPLLWSSLLLPYAESLWAAGQLDLASEVIHTIAERIYTSMDRRTVAAGTGRGHLGWPGVSCEVWGPDGAHGGEGYGWGAVMPAHIVRNLLGVRESADPHQIVLAPNLPESWMSGGELGIVNLAFRPGRLSLQYTPAKNGKVKITGSVTAGTVAVENSQDGSRIATGSGRNFSFEAQNRQRYRLVWN